MIEQRYRDKRQPIEIDRRTFLTTCAAAGMSVTFGPVGFGFPFRPPATPPGSNFVPDTVDQWVYSTCQFCATGCGLHIGLRKGEPVAVRGIPDYPVNRGWLCQKGLLQAEVLRAEDRLTRPLIRRNGTLTPVSWDEALDFIADRTREILERKGPAGVAIYNTGQFLQEEYYVLSKLARGALGTPHLDGNPRLCMASAVVGYVRSFGTDGPPCSYEDIELADFFLVTGHNLVETHPILGGRLVQRLARGGATLVVVDPRATQMARMADIFLPIRPGSDVALYNGMQHVIIRDELVARDYIQQHTTGFDELAAKVADFTPQRTSDLCGVPPADIERAARAFATASGALTLWCMGINQQTMGTQSVNQINNLHLITGQIGREGAGPFSITGQPSSMDNRQAGGGSSLPGYRSLGNAEHRQEVASAWGVPAERIPQSSTDVLTMFQKIEEGEIEMFWAAGTNPAVSMPNAVWARDVLDRTPFLIVQDGWLTETTRYADVVLPAAIWGEKTGTVTNSERRVNLWQQAVKPPGEARSDFDIVCEVGRRLGFAELFPFQSTEEAFDEFKQLTAGRPCDQAGMTFARLEEELGLQWPCPHPGHPGTPRLYTDGRFNTPDGRARLHATDYEPPPETPDDDYPLWLNTGRVQEHWHTRTKTGRVAHLNAWAPEPYVEINPQDAERIGIQSGDRVTVESRRGQITLLAWVTAKVAPGAVFAMWHFGNQPANDLTLNVACPLSRQPGYKACAVRVIPAGPRKGGVGYESNDVLC